jgi:hypothetical protein
MTAAICSSLARTSDCKVAEIQDVCKDRERVDRAQHNKLSPTAAKYPHTMGSDRYNPAKQIELPNQETKQSRDQKSGEPATLRTRRSAITRHTRVATQD